jgi:hypothetical protein
MAEIDMSDDLPTERQTTKNQMLDRAKRQSPEFMRHVAQVLETSIKLKRVMLKRGLRRARSTCPRCGITGAPQGALAGKRDHMRGTKL